MTTLSYRTFASGEVSPSLYARVDLVKYATGLRTCRNNIVLRYGGVANRPGTTFIGQVADSVNPTRLLPFKYSTTQSLVLEFTEFEMKVIKDGARVSEAGVNFATLSNASTARLVFASPVTGWITGDEIRIDGALGMTEINNRNFSITAISTTEFDLYELDGTTPLDTTAYGVFIPTVTATAYKVFKLVTPYAGSELFELNYVQSADVITIVHKNHAPQNLARLSDLSWTLTGVDFEPSVTPPTSISSTVGAAGTEDYFFTVTSVDEEGEESIPGLITASLTLTAATNASPVVITTSAIHTAETGDYVTIDGMTGMTELNGKQFKITKETTTTFSLQGIDGTNFGVKTGNGTVQLAFFKVTTAIPTLTAPNIISWDATTGATEYNIYRKQNGNYSLLGITSGTSLEDIGQSANGSITPPRASYKFLSENNYPSVVAYIQQRLVFANTINDSEKIFLSRTSDFSNFTSRSPLRDNDSFNFTIAGSQISSIKALLDLGRMVIFTESGEWSGGDLITPSTIDLKQSTYNGSGSLSPIVIQGSAFYQQARGSILRDLAYNFETDGYSGNDLTIFSSHLFDKFTLVDWAYQQIPNNILWVVRDDGVLLGMTFVRNQQVRAWHRHELGGLVKSVTTIPEGNEDILYIVIERVVNGVTASYVERLDTRQITAIEDSKFMDSSLSYDGKNTTVTGLTVTGGTNWDFTETLNVLGTGFTTYDVGKELHLTHSDGLLYRFDIITYVNATNVTAKPNKTIPVSLRGIESLSTWGVAVNQLSGLWHIEGEQVAVFGDGFVVASPNNDSYEIVTVTAGAVTLANNYVKIHVGLPYISDIETLDVDTSSGETISDKEKLVTKVTCYVEDTRGVWIGGKPPVSDTIDPLQGLAEVKIRAQEEYDSPVSLTTDVIEVNIEPEWNSNGRVFIRQIDPIPMSILSVNPAGKFPIT